MPIRFPLLLAASWPGGARAAAGGRRRSTYVPGEVIVQVRDGTPSAVPRSARGRRGATVPSRRFRAARQQLAIEDGDSVRETLAELEADPNVAYAVPNYAPRAARSPERPGLPPPVELLRRPTASTCPRPGTLATGSAPPAAAAPWSRCSTPASPTSARGATAARPTCAAARRAALRLRRTRPPPQRPQRPRHARGGHDRPDDEQPASAAPGSPTAPRSCRCACSTDGLGDTRDHLARDPLRRAPRRA